MVDKIYIIGIVASGKTTFSKELPKSSGIPHYELDSIIHEQTANGRYKRTPEEQVQAIHEIDKTGQWIIEGTYRKSCQCLFDLADYVVFLDTPLWKRLIRIFSRFVKQQLKIEPCLYKSDLRMLRMMYKWTFEFEQNRLEFLAMLSQYQDKLLVISDPRAFNTQVIAL